MWRGYFSEKPELYISSLQFSQPYLFEDIADSDAKNVTDELFAVNNEDNKFEILQTFHWEIEWMFDC